MVWTAARLSSYLFHVVLLAAEKNILQITFLLESFCGGWF